MAVSLLESISIARNAVGRLRLTRWQLTKLILAQIWASISFFQLFLYATSLYLVYLVIRTVYRLYWHPLARFPGPKLAAVSNLWFARSWYFGKYFQDIEELHKQYGRFVRTAPNELSIATVQSFSDIYAHGARNQAVFVKSDFYDVGEKERSIVSEQDVDKHREVRRVLAPAFTTAALTRQEGLVHGQVDLLLTQLRKFATKEPVTINEWYKWLTFDVTGELTFGEPFGALKAAQNHFWISTIHDTGHIWALSAICRRYPVLWPLLFFIAPRNLKSAFQRHEAFTREKVRNRIARRNEIKHVDFFTNLLSEKSRDQSEKFMLAQAALLVIGGSDTTALFLTGVTYFLLNRPSTLQKLQSQVRAAFKSTTDITHEATLKLDYLEAVIEEGLRLLPSIPLGLTRVSPGAIVDGEYIPKGTEISTAHWTTAHSADYFADPDGFHPERWLPKTHPDYDARFAGDDRNAARPFSLGPRSCLGIRLAYLESRIVLAKLVHAFDWELTNGDQIDWYRDIKLEGFLTLPNVKVKFTPVGSV